MKRQYNIIGYRRVWYTISIGLILISLAAVAVWHLKLGIDFTGGSLMEVQFKERPALSEVHEAIPDEFGNPLIAPLGADLVTIRLKPLTGEEHQKVLAAITEKFAGATEQRYTSIGPTVGEELRSKSLWAVGTVLLAIVLYIAWAFRKVSRPVASWQYGIAAIVALFHDVFIPVGVFAALGHFLDVEVDTLFITGILTVLGFSVHDTIVVFDRIRENLLKSSEAFPVVVNRSVNETIARSINTSLTTLLVLLTTFFFGGESIRYFVLTLILGILFGTYSSIFIASPLLVSWHSWQEKRKGSR